MNWSKIFTCEYRGKIEVENEGEIDVYFIQEKIV